MTFPIYNRGLVYHKVSEKIEWGLTTTTPKQFKAQMLDLQRLGLIFTCVKDYDQDQNQVLVTFDDGYVSVYDHAAPILEALNGVATVFAITDFVGKKNSWDYFPEDKQVDHMNWTQLRTLHEKGWEIGSHGCSHRRLLSLEKSVVQHELVNSKREIEDRLGGEVKTFCPPFNAWDEDLLGRVEEAGYDKLAISFPLETLPSWKGRFIPRLGVYIHDLRPLFLGKVLTTPLAPFQVLQQQVINLAGDGRLLEAWGGQNDEHKKTR